MSRNLFSVNYKISLEDKFTSSLTYLFNKYPELGQEYVDRLCELSKRPKLTFVEAVDHPEGSAESRPDFLIIGKEGELLFEHKIDSVLGESQLERYRVLAQRDKQKLCVISNRLLEVSPDVLEYPQYWKPKERNHFVWADLYSVFSNSKIEVVQEFAQWMADLGMNSDSWPAHEDPFTDIEAANEFRKCALDLRFLIDEKFGKFPGRLVKRGRKEPCWEIRKALPDVHLVYVSLVKLTELDGWGFSGKYLRHYVIVRVPEVLPRVQEGTFSSSLGEVKFGIFEKELMEWKVKGASLYGKMGYFIEASRLLVRDFEETKSNIENITLEILEHLSKTIRKKSK